MFVHCLDVHALTRCSCDVQMFMRCPDVHAMSRCSCTVQMFMQCLYVHAVFGAHDSLTVGVHEQSG